MGRLEQLAGVQLFEAGDGSEPGVRLPLFRTGAGFDYGVLVDRGSDVGRARPDGRSAPRRSTRSRPGLSP